jgi:hypothetical protein
MTKATNLALVLQADNLLLKRQLADTVIKLQRMRQAGRPRPCTQLDASTNGIYVNTQEQWAAAIEAKEQATRAKKAKLGPWAPQAAPAGPVTVPAGAQELAWDDDVFRVAFEGDFDTEGDLGEATDVEQSDRRFNKVSTILDQGVPTGKAQEA